MTDGISSAQHRFRVFVSYSHKDEDIADKVVDCLRQIDVVPNRDMNIHPGSPFTDAIKNMIMHSHVFMPIITHRSRNRPWVHQEIGYATALDIPILPLAIGDVPDAMISQLQAIKVKDDCSDLAEQLGKISFESVVFPPPPVPSHTVDVADPPERRAQLMAQYAGSAIQKGIYGQVLQQGALSSFCLPDADPDDKIWDIREGKYKKSHYHRQLQREERRALEKHARAAGCILIIDPTMDFDKRVGEGSTRARLVTLLKALESLPDESCSVLITPDARSKSLTIVGDWFSAESRLPRIGRSYEQTIFTCHAPSVLRSAREFLARFQKLCEDAKQDPLATRKTALRKTREIIKRYPPTPVG